VTARQELLAWQSLQIYHPLQPEDSRDRTSPRPTPVRTLRNKSRLQQPTHRSDL